LDLWYEKCHLATLVGLLTSATTRRLSDVAATAFLYIASNRRLACCVLKVNTFLLKSWKNI
jgi:hypothetical protein